MTEDDPWGQLVSLTDIDTEPISLYSDKIGIGRAADSEVCLSENKLVSGHHCFIQRDKDGAVSLHDTSTNGTLLNLTYKISKGKSKPLAHGDEFYIVYKKHSEENNVGYIYQDYEELLREEGTQEYSPPNLLEATLEDIDCNYISPEKSIANKRKSDSDKSEDEKPCKKPKTEKEPSASPTEGGEKKATISNIDNDTASSKGLSKDKVGLVNEVAVTKDKATVVTNECKGSAKDKTEGNGEVKVKSVPDVGVGKDDVDVKGTTSETKSETKPSVPVRDDIEENLQCMICQEIMHDCISLQPCLHSFCAGCYSDWMARSNECPTCRKKVERINKNHIINNLIEAYLKEHPGKKRPEEDIQELNGKNKITHDMLYPTEQLRDSSDYSNTDDDENSDDDRNQLPAPVFPPLYQAPAPVLFGFGTPLFGATRGMKTVCRQCPDYKDPSDNKGIIGGIVNTLTAIKNTVTGATATDPGTIGTGTIGEEPGTSGETKTTTEGEPGPSTSGETDVPKKPKDDVKVMPDPPAHVCTANQNHVLCQCCLQPMPDQRVNPNMPPQQCSICYRSYCHAYWGCRKVDCLGCINTFKEMNFGRKSLVGIILDNQYESEIFRDYIDAKGMSVREVLTECCKGIDKGFYSVTAQGTHNFNTNRPVCFGCGVNVFKQAALQYRKTIKKEDFPEAVRNRPDCYWGSKCRTQRNKPHHAKNFNHVCDQTRQF